MGIDDKPTDERVIEATRECRDWMRVGSPAYVFLDDALRRVRAFPGLVAKLRRAGEILDCEGERNFARAIRAELRSIDEEPGEALVEGES